MSAFHRGAAGFNAQVLRANWDMSAPDLSGAWNSNTPSPWGDAVLWPHTMMSGGATGILDTQRWAAPPPYFGGQSMKKFVGITRDSAGAVLGGAVVQAFLTASDLFLRELTSDAGGYFDLGSQYSAQNHYLVAYKAGSPDVAGTTVNTLQPT